MRFILALLAVAGWSVAALGEPEKPNVVFILADDLGYGDLGCFGQKKIETPNLDQLAAEGMRLTSFYAGSTVCAPSRCVLMTGQHTGRTWVRGNAGAADSDPQTLRPEDVTVAELFREAGYRTSLIGKWGLGELGSAGHPNRQGFDHFFGYLNQRHAHNYFPEFLVRNQSKVPLRNVTDPKWVEMREAAGAPDDGAGWAVPDGRIDYSHDLLAEEALHWIEETKGKSFFLYLALTIPHANNEGARGTGDGQEVPDHGVYADEDWTGPNKGQAAMITRMDRDVGRLIDKLRVLGIDRNTLVIFTSDNGHHREGMNDPEFFDANGPLRGMKRDLYEGGIRVPTIAWWPGKIAAGSESDHAAYFGDFMATAAEILGARVPENTQSASFLPTLLGKPAEQKAAPCLYWEFYEKGSRQAVRFGPWKAIRSPMFTGAVELFNLDEDLGEENNIAASHPEIVERAVAHMEEAHVPNPNWRIPEEKRKKGKK